ncbi:uncharacterized protein MCYG_00549 [Microsporum canis CBS 113480]|uniref:Uncharacterized protein n=1 Tax=Arthroderma otae (strain ATCC MYA-4605 / CBS 113480) TaxID=554155 RepID=C5FCX7_ARTOC|nr:uncharacterized protein MCYG_00549 [Microsporum canis CBS 113480]EEQ27661.1 predicted protein [Microsporum canis CBS 113480]
MGPRPGGYLIYSSSQESEKWSRAQDRRRNEISEGGEESTRARFLPQGHLAAAGMMPKGIPANGHRTWGRSSNRDVVGSMISHGREVSHGWIFLRLLVCMHLFSCGLLMVYVLWADKGVLIDPNCGVLQFAVLTSMDELGNQIEQVGGC